MEGLQSFLKTGGKNEYEKLNDEEDTTMTATSTDVEVFRPHAQVSSAPQQGPIKAVGCPWILQTIFFIFSLILLVLAYVTRSPVRGGCLDQEYIHCKSKSQEEPIALTLDLRREIS